MGLLFGFSRRRPTRAERICWKVYDYRQKQAKKLWKIAWSLREKDPARSIRILKMGDRIAGRLRQDYYSTEDLKARVEGRVWF